MALAENNKLTCRRCNKLKDDIGILGLCVNCLDRFFSNGVVGTAALSKLLGIGSNRILKYEKSGELVSSRNEYGSRVFSRDDIENLLKTRSIKGVRKYRVKETK